MRVPPALQGVVAKRAFAAAMGVLAAVPVAVLWRFISTTGADALSNDYVYWIPVVEGLVGGTTQWSHYFRDTFLSGSHCYAIPVLVTAGLAKLVDLNVDATLGFCLLLSAIKVAMMQDAITGRSTHWLRHALWPVLSALVFSAANINIFTFGFTATHVGLTEFGFVLGVWSLARFGLRWPGLLGMMAGGIIASWSWGSGPVAWPIFAIAMLFLPGPRRRAGFVWAVGAALGCAPYFLYLKPGASEGPLTMALLVDKLWMTLETVGWPFSRAFDHLRAQWAGALGWGLLLVGLGQWARSVRRDRVEVVPSLMLLGYGLAVGGELVLARSALTPWYTGSLSFVWYGLLGLAFAVWTRSDRSRAEAAWSAGLAATIAMLFAANGGYETKIFYLRSRGPASATCLRNHRIAPLSCERQLFQWSQGRPELFTNLATSLERQGWGVFGQSQQWSLQGDSMLESVSFEAPPTHLPVLWAPARSAVAVPTSDYRHLNLFLSSGASVRWSMNLPLGLERAEFTSRLATSEGAEGARTVKVTLQHGDQIEQVFEWTVTGRHPRWETFSVPLTKYAGQEITLVLTAESAATPDAGWAVFKYPVVDLRFVDSGASGLDARTAQVVPERCRPHPSGRDWVFPLADSRPWRAAGLTVIDSWDEGRWWVGLDPRLEFLGALDVPLADYTHLQVTASASPNCRSRMMQVFYRTTGQPNFREDRSFRLPLYPGGNHLYSLPLRELGLAPGARLNGLRVDPLDGPCGEGPTWVQVQNLRLVKRPELTDSVALPIPAVTDRKTN